MGIPPVGRSARKHAAILDAATRVFLAQGYPGTSMEEIATMAAVSKQTVYKHFADKDTLFAEIVLATTDQVDQFIELIADLPVTPGTSRAGAEKALHDLARRFLSTIMQPRIMQLRRLIIANADRFPELGRTWYQQGFERVLATLGATFQRLTEQGHLAVNDPVIAANHFAGLLLWIPVNQAMFCGDDQPCSQAELDRYADIAASTFLAAYRARPADAPAVKAPGRRGSRATASPHPV